MIAKSKRVHIRVPHQGDALEFIEKAKSSRKFLYPWVDLKADKRYFKNYLKRLKTNNEGFFICSNTDDALLGVININEIVAGAFRSGYLGYYIFEPYAGQGYMSEGMRLIIGYAFKKLKLHRLEANIQPGNTDSIKLVKTLGFTKEGFSPRYLKIAGRWRDHERWAILEENWR